MAKTFSTMLPLGTKAIDFTLPNYNSLFAQEINFSKDFQDKQAYVIAFWCNHCPFVIHIEEQFIKIANEYLKKNICFLAISSNDISTHPEDSPQKMKIKSKEEQYPFPYLYDEIQNVAKSYHAACTPDIFVFDENKQLFYRGQMDDSRPGNGVDLDGKDLRFALDCLLQKKNYPEKMQQKQSMGCNIKWQSGNEPDYFFS